MESRPSSAADERNAILGAALALLLAAFAYRALWLHPLSWRFEQTVFLPGAMPALLAAAVAAFALSIRGRELRALPASCAPVPAVACAVVGLVLCAWSALTGATALLLPSLAAHGLALAFWLRGSAGARLAAVPALILLVGVPLPKPLQDEVLWQLQRATAIGAGWLLDVVGHDLVRSGVILRSETHAFHVIDGCSGLGGIVILTMVALVVGVLFAEAGPRLAWLVVLAPPLGMALNVVRVAYVAASPDPEALAGATGNHTPQGLAVLMTGTALLYAAGWMLARSSSHEGAGRTTPAAPARRRIAWPVGVAALAAALSLVPPFSGVAAAAAKVPVAFPEEHAGWTSTDNHGAREFDGQHSGFHRHYRREAGPPGTVVDLLVGFENPKTAATFRLLASKLSFPGADWDLEERRRETLWLLDREVTFSIARRGNAVAVVYAWRPRDTGLWRETWRAGLSLDASPWGRERPRAAVRLVAFAPHDGQLVVDQAKQRLDAFVRDFGEALDAL